MLLLVTDSKIVVYSLIVVIFLVINFSFSTSDSTSMTLSKSFILLLTFMLVLSLGLPCICQVVIALLWVFLAFLSLMSDSLTLIISHIAQGCLMSSQEEPFSISFAAWFPIFYREGTFPQVSLSCTCFLSLSIGMFHCLELVCFPFDTSILLDL